MNRRPLTQKELQKIAQDLVENPELDEETYFPSSDSEFSEEEIEQHDEESASEEENTSDESEGDEETMEEFFIGKNKSTQWRKTTYRVSGKTKGINIVTEPTGLTKTVIGIENEVNAFLQIIDISMIDDVLKCTNMYIDQLS